MTPEAGPWNPLRKLLALFPDSHRERFGDEMWDVVRYRWSQRPRGRLRSVLFHARVAADLIGHALALHAGTLGRATMGGWTGAVTDARWVVRGLLRTPIFTTTALAMLAVAVAVNTAVFAFVRGTLLDVPPYHDPARIVFVWGSNPVNGQLRDVVSGPNFLDLAERSGTLESLAAVHGDEVVTLRDGRAHVIRALEVSVDFLSVLGVTPALGTDFGAEDRMSGGRQGVLVSQGFWRDEFGGDPAVLGATIELDGVSSTVLGVLPEGFRFAGTWPILVPLKDDVLASRDRTNHHYHLVGRLRAGATSTAATRELSAVLTEVAEGRMAGWSILVEPLLEASVEGVRSALWSIAAAVLLVLVVTVVNLGALFRIRTLERRAELAVRVALGAPRRRLAALVLTETVGVAALGGALGLALAPGVLAVLSAIAPPVVLIPQSAAAIPVLRASLGPGVQGFAFGAALLTGALLALPSLATLRSLGRGGEGARSGTRVHGRAPTGWLVASEVALATVLCVAALLTVRSARHLATADVGVEPAGVLSLYFGDVEARPVPERVAYFQRVLAAVEAVPGVRRVGINDYRPFEGEDDFQGVRFPERPPPEPGQGPREEWRRVSEGLFEAAGMRVRSGRGFVPADFVDEPNAVIVNEAFVRKHYAGEDPVGRRLTLTRAGYEDVEVVGVVADVPQSGPTVPAPPVVYAPYQASPRGHVALFVRVAGDPLAFAVPVSEAIWSVDPRQPVLDIAPLADVVRRSRAVPTMMSQVVGATALIALILAGVGVFGVVGYAVRARTRELGVRLALGATAGRLERELVLGSAPLLGIAVLLGLAAASVAAAGSRSLLYGIPAIDPVAFSGAAIVVIGMSVVAAWLPARRVSGVDPARVITQD